MTSVWCKKVVSKVTKPAPISIPTARLINGTVPAENTEPALPERQDVLHERAHP